MDVGPSQNPRSKIHNPPPLANVTQSSMNRGHPNPRKANPKKVNPAAKRPPKGVNAGKTFSEHEAMQQAKVRNSRKGGENKNRAEKKSLPIFYASPGRFGFSI